MALESFIIQEPDSDTFPHAVNRVDGLIYAATQVVFGDPASQQAIFVSSDNPLPVTFSGGVTVNGSVSVSNFPATQIVSATDFDIRNLTFAADKVDASGSAINLRVGSLDVSIANPVPITGNVTTSGAELVVINAIESLAHNLQAAAYSQTTAIGGPYLLNRIELNFSTTASRSITITSSQGTKLYETAGDTSLHIDIDAEDQAFESGDQITVAITQVASTCIVDVVVVITKGALPLSGNPTVEQGTSPWVIGGTVNVGNFPASQAVTGPLTESELQDLLPLPIAVEALPLPAGASTSALQTSGNTSLASIDGKLPPLADGRVPISAASLPLPAGAATAALQSTGNTSLANAESSLAALDDWDESDRAKVNPIVGQAGVAAGSGAISATTQRVVEATDSPMFTTTQGVRLGDMMPYRHFKTSGMGEPQSLFYDSFDGTTIDTTFLWQPAEGNGGTVAQSGGVMSLSNSTTGSRWCAIRSRPTFNAIIPGFFQHSWAIQLDTAALVTQGVRAWGMGTRAVSPTAAVPFIDFIGFVVQTDGKLYAEVWNAGTRIFQQDIDAFLTKDGQYYRFICQVRTDRVFWGIEGLDASNIRATATFKVPSTQILPLLLLAVNGTTQASAMTLNCQGAVGADTGHHGVQLSDFRYQFQKAAVSRSRGLAVESSMVYLTSHQGGHVGFNATTDEVTVSGSAASSFVALFENPAGSGKNIRIWRIGLGNETRGAFKRYRNVTVASRGTPVASVNRGGGSNAAAGRLYSQGQFTLTTTTAPFGGSLGKVQPCPADSYQETDVEGSLLLPPGQNTLFVYVNRSGSGLASGEVIWWEEEA
jgi:hypothetical protein